MGLFSLDLNDIIGTTEFLHPISFYFFFNKLKILEVHRFLVQAAQFVSELHILCRIARWKKPWYGTGKEFCSLCIVNINEKLLSSKTRGF